MTYDIKFSHVVAALVQIVRCWLYCLASWLTRSLRRKKSPIWEHFVVGEDTEFALCRICKQSVSCGGCNTKTYNTTNLVQHLKAKHSEQYVEFEKALERGEDRGQRQRKGSSAADIVTWGQWASSDMGYKKSSCTTDSSASDWDDSAWFPAILYSGGPWFYTPSTWVRTTIFSDFFTPAENMWRRRFSNP